MGGNEFQVSRSVHPVMRGTKLELSPETLIFVRPSKPMVAGSSPAGIARFFNGLRGTHVSQFQLLFGTSSNFRSRLVLMNEPIPLRLKWRLTWPGEVENDFVCGVPGLKDTLGRPVRNIGRIHIIKGDPHGGEYVWYYQANLPGLPWHELTRGGWEPTAREAAKQIEDIWFRVIVGTPYEQG